MLCVSTYLYLHAIQCHVTCTHTNTLMPVRKRRDTTAPNWSMSRLARIKVALRMHIVVCLNMCVCVCNRGLLYVCVCICVCIHTHKHVHREQKSSHASMHAQIARAHTHTLIPPLLCWANLSMNRRIRDAMIKSESPWHQSICAHKLDPS